ncbi:hypothetical protein [Fictibacillus fluitans]|uniref:Big-1 domain-containing protein n=1 Tax=Fictibacillus fluitans TaxID=3058422 RepID=A0ABT8HWC6_9BACL|nr:hypothetical protein [Fictibacillus sp. NE201]MDN4525088.1 hypothetical protein [Fictibacillus sp. NE201]
MKCIENQLKKARPGTVLSIVSNGITQTIIFVRKTNQCVIGTTMDGRIVSINIASIELILFPFIDTNPVPSPPVCSQYIIDTVFPVSIDCQGSFRVSARCTDTSDSPPLAGVIFSFQSSQPSAITFTPNPAVTDATGLAVGTIRSTTTGNILISGEANYNGIIKSFIFGPVSVVQCP